MIKNISFISYVNEVSIAYHLLMIHLSYIICYNEMKNTFVTPLFLCWSLKLKYRYSYMPKRFPVQEYKEPDLNHTLR